MAGIDSYTKLLCHFNGIDGSKEIQDSGATGHIVTQVANATLSTAEKKFGNCSLLLDGTGDYISIPDHADWTLGSGDFTIECWIKKNADAYRESIAGQCNAAGDATSISFDVEILANNKLQSRVFTGGTEKAAESTGTITGTDWHHIAMVRSGNTITQYIDGTADGTVDVTGVTVNNSASLLGIGNVGEYGGGLHFNGNIDEFRIVNGTAIYTANFTAPTSALTAVANTKLLLHMESLDVSSTTPKILTFVADAQLDTAQKEFGTASLLLDGTGDYVTVPDSADWDFGTAPFTIDCWINMASDHYATFFSQISGANFNGMFYDPVNSDLRVFSNGVHLFKVSPWSPTTDGSTWYHIALVHVANNNEAADWRIFIDGVAQTLTKVGDWNGWTDLNGTMYLGGETVNGYYTHGSIDELRISKGIARWTADFTPPTVEYSKSKGGLICMF